MQCSRLRVVLVIPVTLLILLAFILVGPHLKYNLVMVPLSHEWLDRNALPLPPCGAVTAEAWTLDNAYLASLRSRANYRAALGRALWLRGQCGEAIDEWIAAGQDGYQPVGAYLLYTDRWQEMPDRLREDASKYAVRLGNSAQAQGALAESVEWYERSWFLAPSPQAAQWLADHFVSEGKTSEAEAIWTETRDAYSSETEEYWLGTGKTASLGGNWKQAAEAYAEAVKRSSQPASTMLLQAEAYERAGLLAEAEAAYAAVVKLDPHEAAAYAALVTLTAQRQDKAAQGAWQEKAASFFADPSGALGLGYAYLLRGQTQLALPYIEKSYQAYPSDSWSTYLWAQVLHANGKDEQAAKFLAEAIRLHEGRPVQWQVQLGMWFVKLGEREAAWAAYRTASAWGEDSDELRTALESLNDR